MDSSNELTYENGDIEAVSVIGHITNDFESYSFRQTGTQVLNLLINGSPFHSCGRCFEEIVDYNNISCTIVLLTKY